MTDRKFLITMGRRLRFFREHAGISQGELERELNMSPGSLSRIENGVTNPTKETLVLITEFLKMSDSEKSYTYGTRMVPATTAEIDLVKESVSSTFSKKLFLGYVLDDRYRIITISKAMIKILRISNEVQNKYIGDSLIKAALDRDFVRTVMSSEDFKEMLRNLLEIFYAETWFMQDDEMIKDNLQVIKTDEVAGSIWEDIISRKPIELHLNTNRTVIFKVLGVKIPSIYAVYPVIGKNRFFLVEYSLFKGF